MSIMISCSKKSKYKATLALFLVGILGLVGCNSIDDMKSDRVITPLPSSDEIITPPPSTLPPSIMVDDVLYYLAGYTVAIDVKEDEYLGLITSTVSLSFMPSKNGQSNYAPKGAPYVKYEDGMAVFMDDSWIYFEARNNNIWVCT